MSADITCAESLRALKLPAALSEFSRQLSDPSYYSLSFSERLQMILSAQIDLQTQRRIARRIKEAELKINANPEEIDYSRSRGINQAQMAEIMSLGFLRRHQGVLVSGATGVGKTFLICSIGTAAAIMDYRVRYYRLSVLLEEVAIARGDGSYKHLASRLRSKDLLIIDDFGLAPIPSRGSRELLDLLDDRVGVTSTIIASQLPMADTYRSFEDPTVADAILDRIVHSSITLELKGDSMRKRLAEQSTGSRRTMEEISPL